MRWKPDLLGVDWLHAGFSERGGGVSTAYGGESLNLGWTRQDPPENVEKNRQLWVREIWDDARRAGPAPEGKSGPTTEGAELATLEQVHSADIFVLRAAGEMRVDASGRTLLRGDGLMTGLPGLLLGVQTADCVPVLVADTRLRVVAAFHAGWRGTVSRIVQRGVEQMVREFGSDFGDLVAAVGPAIAACCYSVGEEVQGRFAAEFAYWPELFKRGKRAPRWETHAGDSRDMKRRNPDGAEEQARLYLDLHEANRRQLVSAGIRSERVDVFAGECTACSRAENGERRYFSYRAEQGMTGRMLSTIGVRPT